jgi:enoyl-CoA hydratase/carnithine racemase
MNAPSTDDRVGSDGAVRVDHDPATGVVVITLDRPAKLNAVTPAMARDLVAAVDGCNGDDAVRAVVLTGAGDRSFSVGSDVTALDGYATPWDFRNRVDYCDALRRLVKPSIAAVNGYALGGGLETALSCDIRLAADTARFGAPEAKLGWIGGGGMAAFLSRAAGPGNAALMLMTGDPIDAQRALAWHLVSEVLPADALLDRAREVATTIASRAPIAVETAKVNLRAATAMSEDDALRYERDLQTICFATEDAAEGRRAFAEKRPAVFRRR